MAPVHEREWGESPPPALSHFLQSNPSSSDGYNALGILHALREDWPAALAAFEAAVMLTNQYHHYIHYTCSAVHTLRAEWARDEATRTAAIAAALFQDHTNARILALRAGAPLPPYPHALWEDAEWPAAIRLPHGAEREQAWNSGLYLCRDGAPVREAAKEAMRTRDPQTLEQAARLAEAWHKHYHRQASTHRLHRGRAYEASGELWLARDEYRHAHDIDPTFPAPLHYRAALERRLGNHPAAAADDAKAARLG